MRIAAFPHVRSAAACSFVGTSWRLLNSGTSLGPTPRYRYALDCTGGVEAWCRRALLVDGRPTAAASAAQGSGAMPCLQGRVSRPCEACMGGWPMHSRSSSPVLPTILSHRIELPWVSKSSSHLYRGALASLVTALLGRRAALNCGGVGHVRGLGLDMLGSPAPSCLRSCSVCCLGPVGFIAKAAPTDHLSRLSTPFGHQCREPALGVGWVLV